ncbi:recombinase family protein [Streptomyces phytophilus]|uniref:recombinase family protein n=1 Tax=Streptomyces phytophilus TaxID=722715 RepID=UPI0015F10E4E|nr:recombinase family protein [Streptomyces phytophilus]
METPDTDPPRPTLAFIYDRHATLTTTALDERIDRCRRYAVERGWVVAGEWVDHGDQALCAWRRARWGMLAYAMRQAAAPAVCLVDTWDRISWDRADSAILRLAVHRAGGHCVTTAGENDLELGRGRITVAAPLPPGRRP